jgi:hypothetical protein
MIDRFINIELIYDEKEMHVLMRFYFFLDFITQ